MIADTLKKSPLYPILSPVWRFGKAAIQSPLRIWRTTFPGIVILLYHRVGTITSDPHHLTVSTEHFDQQISYLASHTNVLSVAQLYESLQKSRLPRRSVVITFDDGYEDNYTNAFPLLQKHKLPATIFVAGTGTPTTELWWDELAQLINSTDSEYQPAFTMLKQYTAAEREQWLAQMFKEKNIVRTMHSDFRRCSADQLKEMIASGLITIGGHTVNHSQLSVLTGAEQNSEIKTNFDFIKTLDDQSVVPFAYPFGSRTEFNQDSVSIVEKYFPLAFTAYKGHLSITTNRYRLPRFVVKNLNEKEFEDALREFFSFV